MRQLAPTAQQPAIKQTSLAGTHALLQRQCACGQHTIAGGECEGCKNERGAATLSNFASHSSSASEASPVGHEVWRSSGQPFNADMNGLMDSRFHLDFSRVRAQASAPVLGVSSPGSPAEREADAVAARVIGGWFVPQVSEFPSARVHRSGEGAALATAIPESGGMPLPSSSRYFFETRFGRAFNDVRIHADREAARSALSLRADAFTLGRDVYFAQDKFEPETAEGRRLIAHELTHTIQQRDAPHTIMRQETPSGAASSPAASVSSGPGPYDGCQDPQPIINMRAEAARLVAHAVELLDDRNIQRAAPLLATHFRLDPTRPGGAQSISLIRQQFVRMNSALRSGIRIFCRSAPRTGTGIARSSMPVADECRRVRGFSTTCAAGNATATVILCEMALIDDASSLVKTIIHEFAHVACNGSPPITSSGEVYYDGSRFPGNEANALIQADTYAWFAMQASSVQTEPAPATQDTSNRSGRNRAPWWAALGTGLALTLGGIFAPGLLVGGILGIGLGIAGLAGAFD